MVKVKVRWHGFTGSPGYSNFFFREWSDAGYVPSVAEASNSAAKVHQFFDAIKGIFPPVVNIQVEGDAEVINDTDGQLVTAFSIGPFANLQGGAAAANYSAATGAVVSWQTGGVRNGRRVRGRTFLVPTSSDIFDNTGSLTSAAVASVTAAANTLVAPAANSPDMGVYARPSAPGANDGAWFVATGARVPDMAAVLRSRRD